MSGIKNQLEPLKNLLFIALSRCKVIFTKLPRAKQMVSHYDIAVISNYRTRHKHFAFEQIYLLP